MSHLRAAEGRATRFDVRSTDGTPLAVWVDGDGPPLVMVHGSLRDHTTFGPLVDELHADVTTFAMDRRGFGASGDTPGYAIERDFEDVAAVVDAVVARTGGTVAVWGHSYGANCAMGGAALARNVDHLVLYEPSLGMVYPAGLIDAIEEAVAAGDMETAIRAILVEILELTEEECDTMRSGPQWSALLAAAPTVSRECRSEESWVYRPGRFDGIAAPTLLPAGTESPSRLNEATHRAAGAIPDARIQMLEGHAHMAHKTDPAMVATVIGRFIRS